MMETINLAVGDEMVVGPAISATSVRLEFSSDGDCDLVVRDALQARQEQIERLRQRVAELEAEQGVDSGRIAEAIIEHLRERLGP